MKKTVFEQFEDLYFGSIPREGPDLDILDQLDDAERVKAERMLIDALRSSPSLWLAAALGHLRSQDAFDLLATWLPKTMGQGRAFFAEAMWLIRKDPAALEALCDLLNPRGWLRRWWMHDDFGRYQAAIKLGRIDHPRALEALRTAATDSEFVVRSHAQDGLASLLGLGNELAELQRFDRGRHTPEARTALERFLRRVDQRIAEKRSG